MTAHPNTAILDPCCGSRMMWFDRQDPSVSIEHAHAIGRNHGLENVVFIKGTAIDRKPENGSNSLGVSTGGVAGTLTATDCHAIQHGMAVRRLTPLECERLMGFPDGYTAVPFRGKPASDAARYKAFGNSWAVNCARWIGERIAAVDAITNETRSAE